MALHTISFQNDSIPLSIGDIDISLPLSCSKLPYISLLEHVNMKKIHDNAFLLLRTHENNMLNHVLKHLEQKTARL